MSKSVLFKNWSAEDFSWTWDGVSYDFPAGQSMYLQDYLAEHFAKHLADREMVRSGFELNYRTRPERQGFIDKCFASVVAQPEASDAHAEFQNLNRNADIEAASPRKRKTKIVDVPEEVG